ncbi:MAG: S8 family serine peptidase [Cellulosilyticaceae bacterium]
MPGYNTKISPQLQLMLRYQKANLLTSFIETTGIIDPMIWQVLVQYTGNVALIPEELYIAIQIVDEEFLIMTMDKNNITRLSESPSVRYIELPEVMQYILDVAIGTICGTGIANPKGIYNVTGRGTLIAIIDSGIDYTHPDFIREDRTSRIAYIWDQTIVGNPPIGFKIGSEYTNEQINEALRATDEEAQLAIVPSQDVLGHGTIVAGVAAGNGRASQGQSIGVAPESDLIVVKVGQEGPNVVQTPFRGPRNIETMLAIKYVLEKAIELNKPISINIGFGINEGAHDGTSALEEIIDKASDRWKCNITVGTGNQANKDSHAMGTVKEDETKQVQIFIDKKQKYYYATLWKSFADDFGIVIQAPNGEKTEVLTRLINNRAFIFGNTQVLINFSESSDGNIDEQILIILDSFNRTDIDNGIWTISIVGLKILDGRYNIWGESLDLINRSIRFLVPSQLITLTIPSTASKATSVAASGLRGVQIANFAGRGFTRTGMIKPDLAAPGIDVMTASINKLNRYQPATGTSVAAAFVTGAYALFMQYGIVDGRDEFLYGERLKAYVLRNTTRIPIDQPYPNKDWGYGVLCIRAVLDELREKYASS